MAIAQSWTQRHTATTLILNLLLLGCAIWVLNRILREYHPREIVHAWSAVPVRALGLAFLCTILGYVALVGYDYVAFRFVGRPLAWRTMLVPSFATFAVSNTAPISIFTAGGLRYRLYAGVGLTPAEAARIVSFNVVTYALGLFVLTGLLLITHPSMVWRGSLWHGDSARWLGIGLLCMVFVYMIVAVAHRTPAQVFGSSFQLPSLRMALQQMGISVADWLLSSTALYVLIASVTSVQYFDFLMAFLTAQTATLIIPTPGGIGVFEAILLLLRPSGASVPHVLAAVLLYRVVYYLIPLLIAVGFLVGRRSRPWHRGRHEAVPDGQTDD